MTASVNDLFNEEPGSASLLLLPCEAYGVPHARALAFGVVVQLVVLRSRARDKLVGVIPAHGRDLICPDVEREHAFAPGDRLIIISRRTREEIEGLDADGSVREPTSPPVTAAALAHAPSDDAGGGLRQDEEKESVRESDAVAA